MKVYFNGFNLQHQLPHENNIIETFIGQNYTNERLRNVEVSYFYSVLLVADTVLLKGAKNSCFDFNSIRQICCNEDKVLVLQENGDLFKITDSVALVPKLPNLEENDFVIKISIGSKLLVLLTKHSHLYNFHNKLDFKSDKIIDFKTGREHCVILNVAGEVFTFGRGSRGQLGHDCLDDVSEPQLVEALGGVRIKSISVGGWHSCALSDSGDLYVWGWNSNGQLGISNDEQLVARPTLVDLDFNIALVGCGNKHTVVLSENKELWGCGWNKYKQLIKSLDLQLVKMTFLKDFSEENVIGIQCGPWNTLILCE